MDHRKPDSDLRIDPNSARYDQVATAFPEIYQELRRVAARYLNKSGPQTLQATALVHEAYLKLARNPSASIRDRSHFLAVAALAMRQILVNAAEKRHAAKRQGIRCSVEVGDLVAAAPDCSEEVLALNEALSRLTAIDPRKARIVELRFFGGLSVEEVAETLSISDATVERDFRLAKAWLKCELSKS